MSDTLTQTRPSGRTRHPERRYGVLLSWAPMDPDTGEREVWGEFPSIMEATVEGGRIALAGGAQYVVVHKDTPDSPWVSPGGYTLTETMLRWWGEA